MLDEHRECRLDGAHGAAGFVALGHPVLVAHGDGELDEAGRLRVDQLELDPEVQAEVAGIWEQINTDNLKTLADFEGYRQEFLQLFGFGVEGVDYDADVDPAVAIEQMVS
mgnify:CR=1 FL=1